jgi:hypothetical protein
MLETYACFTAIGDWYRFGGRPALALPYTKAEDIDVKQRHVGLIQTFLRDSTALAEVTSLVEGNVELKSLLRKEGVAHIVNVGSLASVPMRENPCATQGVAWPEARTIIQLVSGARESCTHHIPTSSSIAAHLLRVR